SCSSSGKTQDTCLPIVIKGWSQEQTPTAPFVIGSRGPRQLLWKPLGARAPMSAKGARQLGRPQPAAARPVPARSHPAAALLVRSRGAYRHDGHGRDEL